MTYFCFLKCRKRDLLLFVGLKAEVIEQDIIQRLGLTLINLIRVNEGSPTQTDIFLKALSALLCLLRLTFHHYLCYCINRAKHRQVPLSFHAT